MDTSTDNVKTEVTSDGKQRGSAGLVKTQIAKIVLPPDGFQLESGQRLAALDIAYETYGQLSPGGDNVIFICHALSGDAHVAGYHDDSGKTYGWWDEMVGPGKGIDTNHYHVVCANILGGCMGTTGPCATNPATGKPYGSAFPRITIADVINAHRKLLDHLGIKRLAAVIGGSFGGMQALQWTMMYPDTVDHCICIASASSLSAQALAFDIVGRSAITSDPNWQNGDYYGTTRTPDKGLALARKIGHITYLSPEMMSRKFGRERTDGRQASAPAAAPTGFRSDFQVESYLFHQGRKFVDRFDANSYLHITQMIDECDLEGKAGSLEKAFAPIKAKVLVVSLSMDWLFPPEQSIEIANALLRAGKHVSYCNLYAPHGHDAFLVDIAHLAEAIRAFLPWVEEKAAPRPQTMPVQADKYCMREYDHITRLVQPGSRVLDLGCGNGEMLSLLTSRKNVSGIGMDIDLHNVIDVIDKGYPVFQADIDAGLAMVQDQSYDYAILGETLQIVKKPQFVLREMLRVARKGIVTFPNFGKWHHRLSLCLGGRMPENRSLPYTWYNTPNIHLFTLRDFFCLCREENIEILDVVCISRGALSRVLLWFGLCNFGADRVVALISRRTEESKCNSGSVCSKCCR